MKGLFLLFVEPYTAGTRDSEKFFGKFDYVVLICPTFAYNNSLYRFAETDPPKAPTLSSSFMTAPLQKT